MPAACAERDAEHTQRCPKCSGHDRGTVNGPAVIRIGRHVPPPSCVHQSGPAFPSGIAKPSRGERKLSPSGPPTTSFIRTVAVDWCQCPPASLVETNVVPSLRSQCLTSIRSTVQYRSEPGMRCVRQLRPLFSLVAITVAPCGSPPTSTETMIREPETAGRLNPTPADGRSALGSGTGASAVQRVPPSRVTKRRGEPPAHH